MSAAENTRSALGRSKLTFSSEADIGEFVTTLARYEKGELTADQWRAFRLVRGTYGQRQDDVAMLRVKIPQGILDKEQLRALADVAERYSRGYGHITTRQNVQFHFVKLKDAEAAMRRFHESGLTTREACGNSVRNITGCPYSGVSRDEIFDTTPYAQALTRYFLRHRAAASLPRKFKIGFEGCATDHALMGIHDIGWQAKIQDGKRGFKVYVAGGTSILCRSGYVLYEFLPVEEMLNVAEAILRVFHGLGDYKHKARNRMKFLIKELGYEKWKVVYEAALQQFIDVQGGARLSFDGQNPPVEVAPNWPKPVAPSPEQATEQVMASKVIGPGIVPEVKPAVAAMNGDLSKFRATNVEAQRQAGYSMVTARLVLGDFTGQQMRVLGDLAESYGDGRVCVTINQDLVFRWVRNEDVPELYRRLAAAGMGMAGANTIADVVSCPGAESCRLAVSQSRGLGSELTQFLESRPDLCAIAPDLQIKMSGCPNGCGQHHVAGIGFQGSVRQLGKRVLPQYFVLLGGGTLPEGGARFGRLTAKIPARRVTSALERLLRLYEKERRKDEKAADFFARVEVEHARSVLLDLEKMTLEDAQKQDFIDLGEDHEYKVEIMDGECSA
jgi:sulfite reductase (NADPH) hemoprotein beta-component